MLLESVSNPLSRLIRRVLFLEAQRELPFARPHSNTHRVLEAAHDYLAKTAGFFSTTAGGGEGSEAGDLGVATVKTIVVEVIKCIGSKATLTMLQVSDIPAIAAIYK